MSHADSERQMVLGVTGASGAVYARRLARCLVDGGVFVHLVISPYGRQVMKDELRLPRITVESFLGGPTERVRLYGHRDLGARIASGSFPTEGMVVCPCSTRTLGAIASGIGDNLVTRAAAVTLKERRRLVLMPREMPLSRIDLENALRCAEAGAVICPACPGFYLAPRTIDDLVDFVVGRVLDLVAVPHRLPTRWVGRPDAEESR